MFHQIHLQRYMPGERALKVLESVIGDDDFRQPFRGVELQTLYTTDARLQEQFSH